MSISTKFHCLKWLLHRENLKILSFTIQKWHHEEKKRSTPRQKFGEKKKFGVFSSALLRARQMTVQSREHFLRPRHSNPQKSSTRKSSKQINIHLQGWVSDVVFCLKTFSQVQVIDVLEKRWRNSKSYKGKCWSDSDDTSWTLSSWSNFTPGLGSQALERVDFDFTVPCWYCGEILAGFDRQGSLDDHIQQIKILMLRMTWHDLIKI